MLLLHAGLDPPLEGLHLLVGPRPVARHRPALQALEDTVGMALYVLVGPQVEGPFHRLPVHWTKEWFDVEREAHLFIRRRQCNGLFLLLYRGKR